MAKWGRGPALDHGGVGEQTNMNDWQWTEQDVTSWSKGKFHELLVVAVVENRLAAARSVS